MNIYQLPKGKKLKSCPFCKMDLVGMIGLYIVNTSAQEAVDASENGVTDQHGCFVTCECCQADGPWFGHDQIDEAIDGWNNRKHDGVL